MLGSEIDQALGDSGSSETIWMLVGGGAPTVAGLVGLSGYKGW